MDFSQNTRGPNRYGLVVTDVFTREVATKALPNKQSGTVTQAAAEIIPELNEFRGLEGALPEPAVHREKLPSDRIERHGGDRPGHPNAEEGPGGEGGRDGGGWAEHVAEVTEAHNARPVLELLAAFVGARKAPASSSRRCRPSVRFLLCSNFSALSRSTQKVAAGFVFMSCGATAWCGRCGSWRATTR